MTVGVPFCDSPGQSLVVGLGAGFAGGLTGIALGLDAVGVVVLAGGLALLGEVAGHAIRGDFRRERTSEQLAD